MTDLVDRLRKQDCQTMLDAYDVMDAAADEIERLKAELDTIGQMIGSAIDVAVFKQVKRERRGQTAKNGKGD